MSDPLDEATERLPPAALLVAALRDVREEVRATRAELGALRAERDRDRELLQAALAGHHAVTSWWGAMSARERLVVGVCVLALASGSGPEVARLLTNALVPHAP